MDINRANLTIATTGFTTVFLAALHGSKPEWGMVAMKASSSNASEEYHWLGALPSMKKFEGEIEVENLTNSQYVIRNEEFESTVAVKQAHIEQDALGIYTPRFQAMGIAANHHPDELVFGLLSDGFFKKDYTGKPFYSENKKHEPDKAKSATFSNIGSDPLSAAAYTVAKANIRGRKNSRGRSMKLGKKLMLVVPPALEDTAREILFADRNQAGATNIQKDTATLLVNSDLATDTEWHLCDSGQPIKPLIFQEEKPVEFLSQDDPEDDCVFENHEFRYQAYGRYNVGFGLSQLAYGSTGVGG